MSSYLNKMGQLKGNIGIFQILLTFFMHTNTPSSYQADQVLIARYLINWVPSSVIKKQIPSQILLPRAELFQVALKVFGCVCFVHLLDPERDKVAPRAIKCVPWIYSQTQKGYRCMHVIMSVWMSPSLSPFLIFRLLGHMLPQRITPLSVTTFSYASLSHKSHLS